MRRVVQVDRALPARHDYSRFVADLLATRAQAGRMEAPDAVDE
jgi:hypothetical protein